jgi:O-methyltransferase
VSNLASVLRTHYGRQSARRAVADLRHRRELGPSLERVSRLSMISDERLLDIGRFVANVLDDGIPGNLVECGVWRGGASFLMADILERHGDDQLVWMFDSFEGLPLPEEIDGPAALRLAAGATDPSEFKNCVASLEEVTSAAASLGLSHRTRIVKGWFDQTLPAAASEIGQIALLHIDADWHASVKCCLEHLYDSVSPNGFVVFDDYFTYDGCAVAVHEFLGARRLGDRLQATRGHAYFRKAWESRDRGRLAARRARDIPPVMCHRFEAERGEQRRSLP